MINEILSNFPKKPQGFYNQKDMQVASMANKVIGNETPIRSVQVVPPLNALDPDLIHENRKRTRRR